MRPVVVMAHHTPDVYGSDRQLLESVTALAADFRIVVTLPGTGPLVPLLESRGAEVVFLRAPVLRKSVLTPRGLLGLLALSLRQLGPAVRLLRRQRASVVYVNTLVLPFWLVAARFARVPAVCHVHEARTDGPRSLRALLVSPLLLARRTVTNSHASLEAIRAALPLAARNAVVIHNGVPGPPEPPTGPRAEGPHTLALVARLSPIKGIDIAIEATARLLARGYDVELDVVGSVFPGYEPYELELRTRAGREDLGGRVRFLGYVNPTWGVLASATVVLVPSREDAFGNTAVEAQLAMRPVVASRVQGLPEIVEDGETGLLVPPGDPDALADAVARLLDDRRLAVKLAAQGQAHAIHYFSTVIYAERIYREVSVISNI